MQMEEAKAVVKIASSFLKEQEPSARDTRLEQLEEHTANVGEWSVVLSFPDPIGPPWAALGGTLETPRVYKELVVNSKSREVVALRFWK